MICEKKYPYAEVKCSVVRVAQLAYRARAPGHVVHKIVLPSL